MYSWVRYSVAVYLGLLLAGSLAMPSPTFSDEALVSDFSDFAAWDDVPLLDHPLADPAASLEFGASSPR
jgi:hypothetical protein